MAVHKLNHIVPKMIREKVIYVPHDGERTCKILIGDTTFNHIEICRLHILLERVLYDRT